MAEIRKLLWMRHLRAEATNHVLYYRRGALARAGRGLAFWFNPMSTALAEVPVDDRDLNYLFKGRTRDFQEVVVQGVISYRVVDAKKLAERVDFAIDLKRGTHVKQPLEQIAILLTGIAQQAGLQVIARAEVAELLVNGFAALAATLEQTLRDHPSLTALGIDVENVRIDELKPTVELERALQTPTREQLQQRADEATFRRRALAVEKERAIAENELQTRVELARREEALIAQQGQNVRQKVEREAEARRLGVVAVAEDQHIEAKATSERQLLETEAQTSRKRLLAAADADEQRLQAETAAERQRLEGAAAADRTRHEAAAQADTERLVGGARAERTRLQGLAEAETVRAIGEAKAFGEQKRLDAYRDLPPQAVLALAAQELAGQLKIDNLTITPDMLGGLLEKAARLGFAKLEGGT
ncbi:MAG TPA: SPFH domain-containing protein [Polyangiaceae bacterium]|jgi:regulator of protease activity HflC (stomatin/prohibitin superfamily)